MSKAPLSNVTNSLMPPTCRHRVWHVASLWTLRQYPTANAPWSIEQQLDAIVDAGFQVVTGRVTPDIGRLAQERGLRVLGFVSSGDPAEFPFLLADQLMAGAKAVNVQLGDHDTPTDEAVHLWHGLLNAAERLDLRDVALEVHRDTCTETPEKAWAIADAHRQTTGDLVRFTWDFSHFAIVKHLAPADYAARLLVRPELIAHSNQFHLRPFNGHHAQVPVTDGHDGLSREFCDWLPFAEALLQLWFLRNGATARDLYLVAEMGPVSSGYNLAQLPAAWDDAVRLRQEVGTMASRLQ